MIKSILLFLFLALSSFAQAADRVQIVAIEGPYAVSNEQVVEIYKQASPYFKELGLTLRVKFLRYSEDPCDGLNTIESRILQIYCYQRHSIKKGYARKKVYTYYMTPPWFKNVNGVTYSFMAGMAFKICGHTATGNALEFQFPYGYPRLSVAGITVAHELGHLFCATHWPFPEDAYHVKDCHLMHPDALRCSIDSNYKKLEIKTYTKHQVKRALMQRRRK